MYGDNFYGGNGIVGAQVMIIQYYVISLLVMYIKRCTISLKLLVLAEKIGVDLPTTF